MVKVISYSDSKNSAYYDFLEYHKGLDVFIELNSRKRYPRNYCKIAAISKLLELLDSDFEGFVIFCDIDTRIIKLPKTKKETSYDIGVYCRKFYPLNLSLLSGFLLFKINDENRLKLYNLLSHWYELYHNGSPSWYRDQESLAISIINSIFTEKLIVRNLNSLKGRLTFFWSNIPWPLTCAFTHKGSDIFISYATRREFVYFSRVADLFLIVPNYICRILRK
jgi:hypothetical protein